LLEQSEESASNGCGPYYCSDPFAAERLKKHPENLFGRATACSVSHENAVVASRGKSKLRYSVFHDASAVGIQHTILSDLPRAHLRVGVDVRIEEAPQLRICARQ